jgi:hypothetical protein
VLGGRKGRHYINEIQSCRAVAAFIANVVLGAGVGDIIGYNARKFRDIKKVM